MACEPVAPYQRRTLVWSRGKVESDNVYSMSLRVFASSAASSIKYGDTDALINHLALNNSQALTAVFEMRGSSNVKQLLALVEDRLRGIDASSKWARVLGFHLSSIRHLQQNDMQACCLLSTFVSVCCCDTCLCQVQRRHAIKICKRHARGAGLQNSCVICAVRSAEYHM